MPRGIKRNKPLNGKLLSVPEFHILVIEVVQTLLKDSDKITAVDVCKVLDPCMDQQTKTDVSNYLRRMVQKGALSKDELKYYRAAENLSEPSKFANLHVTLTLEILKFMGRNGGYATRSEILAELDRGADYDFERARTVDILLNECYSICRVWKGLYSLIAEERAQLIYEGRWAYIDTKAAVINMDLQEPTEDDDVAEMSLKRSPSAANHLQNKFVEDAVHLHFAKVGYILKLLRIHHGLTYADLGEDPKLKEAIQQGELISGFKDVTDWLEALQKEYPETWGENWVIEFEGAHELAHKGCGRDVYKILAERFGISPIGFSRGLVQRNNYNEREPNYMRTVASTARARLYMLQNDKRRALRNGYPVDMRPRGKHRP